MVAQNAGSSLLARTVQKRIRDTESWTGRRFATQKNELNQPQPNDGSGIARLVQEADIASPTTVDKKLNVPDVQRT